MASNSSVGKARKSNGVYCCVVNCHRNNVKDKESVSFFRFPKRNEEQRKKWIQAVRRKNQDGSDWEPNSNSRICSEHFVGGWWSPSCNDPDYVPTVFPTNHVEPKSNQDLLRFERARARSLSKGFDAISLDVANEEVCHVVEVNVILKLKSERVLHAFPLFQFATKSTQTETTLGFSCAGQKVVYESIDSEVSIEGSTIISKKGTQITTSTYSETEMCTDSVIIKDFGHSASQEASVFQVEPKLMTERQFVAYFGIQKSLFNFILELAGEDLKCSINITRDAKLALFLTKLKMNPTFSALSGMFKVGEKAAKGHFTDTLSVMVKIAKTGVIWYSKDIIKSRLPPSFRALYPDCRVIIDCSEIPCQKPAKLKQRTLLYSNYKSRHTLKFLVGCAPSGEITFISETYGGRTTDTEITVKSGLLDLIEPNDTILADKGFPRIESDVNANGGVLVMPPFKHKNNPFTSSENKTAYQCASVRVHVERCIARMKVFECLHFVKLDLFPHIDDILYVVSYLCNMGNDLIKQD